jgi:hypothetical protein
VIGRSSAGAVIAFAYAEPQARYTWQDLKTTARKEGEGYVLNGHKAVVLGAPWATHLIVTARTGGGQRDATACRCSWSTRTRPAWSPATTRPSTASARRRSTSRTCRSGPTPCSGPRAAACRWSSG